MIFVPKLVVKVVDGSKSATRRRISDNPNSPWRRKPLRYPEGKMFAVQPGRGVHGIAHAVVTRRAVEPLHSVTSADARKEGFATRAAFVKGWGEINGSYDPDELVHVIEFDVVDSTVDWPAFERLRERVIEEEAGG